MIHDDHGVLCPVSYLTPEQRMVTASARNYRARSEIALDVASNYPGGDYFEFGAGSLNSFRAFLAAFDLYELATVVSILSTGAIHSTLPLRLRH